MDQVNTPHNKDAPELADRLEPLRLINEDELEWVAAALQRYVQYRDVDRDFVRQLIARDNPGEDIDPDDPGYGDQVLTALMEALVARRRRRNNQSTLLRNDVLAIRETMPEAYCMMQSLERFNIDYGIVFVPAPLNEI